MYSFPLSYASFQIQQDLLWFPCEQTDSFLTKKRNLKTSIDISTHFYDLDNQVKHPPSTKNVVSFNFEVRNFLVTSVCFVDSSQALLQLRYRQQGEGKNEEEEASGCTEEAGNTRLKLTALTPQNSTLPSNLWQALGEQFCTMTQVQTKFLSKNYQSSQHNEKGAKSKLRSCGASVLHMNFHDLMHLED